MRLGVENWQAIADLLQVTRSLKELILDFGAHGTESKITEVESLRTIAEALQTNTSLEKLTYQVEIVTQSNLQFYSFVLTGKKSF